VTVILPLVAPFGTVVVIWVGETTVKAALFPLNLTAVTIAPSHGYVNGPDGLLVHVAGPGDIVLPCPHPSGSPGVPGRRLCFVKCSMGFDEAAESCGDEQEHENEQGDCRYPERDDVERGLRLFAVRRQ
jgi:hypothetical protein